MLEDNSSNKKIILIASAVVLVIVLIIGTFFLVKLNQDNRSKANTDAQPLNVYITNLTDTSATLVFNTNIEVNSTANYGTDDALGSVAEDERGASISSKLHYINFNSLIPDKKYYFKIISDGTEFDNLGSLYQFQTLTTLNNINTPKPVYGKVSGQVADISATVVSLEIFRDGKEFTNNISSLVNTNGTYTLDLSGLRSISNSTYVAQSGDKLVINAFNENGTKSQLVSNVK